MSGHKARFTPKVEIDTKRKKCKKLPKKKRKWIVCKMWKSVR